MGMLRVLLVLVLLVPFAVLPVTVEAAVGGRLYGTGGDITVEILASDAGYTSELHLYSPWHQFLGTNRETGRVITISGVPAGVEVIFGIYVRDTGDTFKMGPGDRNMDGQAHADLFQVGEREFIVGFEDVFGGGDRDYDDNRFRFSGALAPEPPPQDALPPVSQHSPAPDANFFGWVTHAVAVDLTSMDTAQQGAEVSGVERIFATVDGAPAACPMGAACSLVLDGSGVHQISYYARDNAGNSEQPNQFAVGIDLDAPVITHTAAPAPTTGWNNTPVSVEFHCADALSGIESCPAGVTLDETTSTFTVTAADKAGNTGSLHVSLQIDQTAPTITGAPDRAPNGAGWYNADVTITFACADGLSGIASCTGAWIIYEGAGQSATGAAVDNAGNISTATVGPINVDKTAPTVTFTGNAGTYEPDDMIAIDCVASDALSGIAESNCAPIAGPAWSFGIGSHLFAASATDQASNTGGATAAFSVSLSEESLCRMVTAWSSKEGVAKSLCAKLRNAAKASSPETRINLIEAFMHELEAQSGKAFTEERASILLSLARSL